LSTNYPKHLQNILAHLAELSTDDLRLVNKYIVDRSKALSAQSTEKAIAQFTPGDSVSFVDKKGFTQHVKVLKINKKTVGVANAEGDRWNISPELLALSTPPDNQYGSADHVATASVSTLPKSQNTGANETREWVGGGSTPQLYSDIAGSNYCVSRFFESTAALYTFAPWKTVPHDECIIGITAESLGVTDGVLCIIGQQQESFGVLLFDSLNSYERYGLLMDAMARGSIETIPPHRALTFDNATDIEPKIRKDIVRHQWKVADPNAYPNLMCPDDDNLLRPITEEDIELFDVIAQTLPSVLRDTNFVDALKGNGTSELDNQVLTKNRPVLVVLQAPYPYQRVLKAQGAKDDLIADLLLLERTATNSPDWARHDAITTKLLDQYLASPEAKACDSEFGSASLIMSMAFNYCSCTIASITPLAFEEILFSIIPRKVMIQAEDAADIIDDSRAFLQFLIREYNLERAKACLTILNSNAVNDLTSALEDPSNFGMGKSIFTSNDRFLMDTAPELLPKLSATKPKPADKKSRKKKRSTARKARKKNR